MKVKRSLLVTLFVTGNQSSSKELAGGVNIEPHNKFLYFTRATGFF